MSAPTGFVPRRSRTVLERRYWAAVYFLRRLVFLALMVWAAVTCAVNLPAHPVAAGAGLLCAAAVLYVQGGWVWRRYRRWWPGA